MVREKLDPHTRKANKFRAKQALNISDTSMYVLKLNGNRKTLIKRQGYSEEDFNIPQETRTINK